MDHVLKKWKKLAITNNGGSSSSSSTPRDQNSKKKSIKFLKKKKTLSFSSSSSAACSPSWHDHGSSVPKGSVAVCVGEEMKRFVIPTEYLCRRPFGALLREAEEEYGFEQEGVLQIPCPIAVFKRVLKTVEEEKEEEEFCYEEAVESEMVMSDNFGLPSHQKMMKCIKN